jgi:hypothetical protein
LRQSDTIVALGSIDVLFDPNLDQVLNPKPDPELNPEQKLDQQWEQLDPDLDQEHQAEQMPNPEPNQQPNLEQELDQQSKQEPALQQGPEPEPDLELEPVPEIEPEPEPRTKQKMPNRTRKFGKGATRDGNRKSSRPATVDHQVITRAPEDNANAGNHTSNNVATSKLAPFKRMNKKELCRSLDSSTTKLKCSERKVETTTKKLYAANAQSTVLVKLAQEQRKEGYLIHEQAEIDVNAIRLESENSLHVAMCKIAAIISESHNAIIGERAINAAKYKSKAAVACKRHAKEMLVQQRECNILVNDVKKKAATTRKQHTNQLIVQQKDF